MAERTVLVRLRATASDFNRAMASAKRSVSELREEIDTTNDRTAWLAQSILALGPALVPLGAAGVPIIAGLTTQMTLAAAAGGTMALAFNGVGDALKAVNDYQLKPTVENLHEMNLAMEKIGPEGAHFVQFLDEIGPRFATLQAASRQGMFPGMEEGIEEFATLLPKLRNIVFDIGTAIGDLTASAGTSLAGPRFREFFDYMEREAQPILMQMGRTFGNFVDGLAAMIVAFGPLTADFSGGFEDMSKDFADWAHNLDENQSFQDFLAYIQESTPKAIEFIGALTDAFVSILKAAAPVGDIMLPVLSDFLEIISALADTPLGPVFLAAAAAMSLYGRAVALASITTGGMFGKLAANTKEMGKNTKATALAIPTLRQFGNTALHSMHSQQQLTDSFSSGAKKAMESRNAVASFARGMAPAASAVGLLALSMSDLDDKVGLTNTTMFALAGLMVGGGIGAGIGAVAGGVMDLKAAADASEGDIEALNDQLERLGDMAAPEAYQQVLDQIAEKMEQLRNPDFSDKSSMVAGFWKGLITDGELVTKSDLLGDLRKLQGEARNLQLASRTALNDPDYEKTKLSEAVEDLDSDLLSTKQSADALASALDALFGPKLGLSEAVDKQAAALQHLKDELDDTSRSLVGQNDGARANREAIRGLVQGALDLVQAQADAGASSETLAKSVKRQRDAIMEAGIAAGLSEKELRRYLRRLGLTPEVVETLIKANTGEASDNVRRFQQQLAGIKDKTITIYANYLIRKKPTNTADAGQIGIPEALGGFYPRRYADGGMDVRDRHQPEIARAGAWRIWAEDETGGETYIPHANDHRRPKAKQYLEQTAEMFGGRVEWFAGGGMRTPTPAGVSAATPSRQVVVVGGHVSGVVKSPWGDVPIEGTIREIAREEIDADRDFDKVRSGK